MNLFSKSSRLQPPGEENLSSHLLSSEMGSNRLFASSSSLSREFFRLVKVGVESMSAGQFVRRAVRVERDPNNSQRSYLVVNSPAYSPVDATLLNAQQSPERRFALNNNVYVAAFGKAALGNGLFRFLFLKILSTFDFSYNEF